MMQRPRFLALALAAAGLMAYNGPATAQTGEQPPARAGTDSTHRMFDPVSRILEQKSELKLTDEQATRLETIRAKYLEKNQAQIEELRRDREARAAFRARMDSTRTEVLAVLTPEQQKQVKAMRKQWREGRHGRRHSHDQDDDD